jgi:hypothetical protein
MAFVSAAIKAPSNHPSKPISIFLQIFARQIVRCKAARFMATTKPLTLQITWPVNPS